MLKFPLKPSLVAPSSSEYEFEGRECVGGPRRLPGGSAGGGGEGERGLGGLASPGAEQLASRNPFLCLSYNATRSVKRKLLRSRCSALLLIVWTGLVLYCIVRFPHLFCILSSLPQVFGIRPHKIEPVTTFGERLSSCCLEGSSLEHPLQCHQQVNMSSVILKTYFSHYSLSLADILFKGARRSTDPFGNNSQVFKLQHQRR